HRDCFRDSSKSGKRPPRRRAQIPRYRSIRHCREGTQQRDWAPNRDGGREVAPPIDVALKMLRTLLEERFKLVTHKETRPLTAYALLPPKGETKLKKADPSERQNCRPDPSGIPANTGGVPMQAGTCINTTIEEFARILPQVAGAYFDHPVVDATGLQGSWN